MLSNAMHVFSLDAGNCNINSRQDDLWRGTTYLLLLLTPTTLLLCSGGLLFTLNEPDFRGGNLQQGWT